MIHIPGVKHKAPDAVSRHPTGPTNPDKMILPDDIAVTTHLQTTFPLHHLGRSILAGIRRKAPPPQQLTT